jgi:hypothetical protein
MKERKLGRRRHEWEDNIGMNPRDVRLDGEMSDVAYDRHQ